jgi:hypothetical protein
MSTSACVGRSTADDSTAAGRAAAEQALAGLPDAAADLCLVFATSGYDQGELLAGVRAVAGEARISGCSGEGIIAHRDSLECDRAVAVMAVRSRALRFDPLLVRDYEQDPAARGRELAAQVGARANGDAIGLLVFPDGLRGDCTELLRALEAELPCPLLVAGGTSADAMTMERTWQYFDGEAASNAVAGVLVTGDGRLEVAVSHGCLPIGLERRVTSAEGGWLRGIDGTPTWDVFKEYLDGDPDDLSAEGITHLCIGEPLDPAAAEGYAPFVIRTPLSLEKSSGALFFPGGGLESGRAVRLTRRDPDRIRRGARDCARSILERSRGQQPALVLQFDCAGRGKALFGSGAADEIVRPLQQVLGSETPWIGFHTYGEIAPIAGAAYYHNYTVVLCALFEGRADD